MSYFFNASARVEHLEHVAYYESQQPGLGARYLGAFDAAMVKVCEAPHRYRVEFPPNIRRYRVPGFPYKLHQYLISTQRLPHRHLAVFIHPTHRKYVLCQIQPNAYNLHCGPPRSLLGNKCVFHSGTSKPQIDLRRLLHPTHFDASTADIRKLSARISRQLRILRAHSLIRKLPKSHRYRLTSKGHQLTAALSAIRQTNLKRLIGTHPTPT